VSARMYGLYFARASCPNCLQIQIKRRLYTLLRPHPGTCHRCGSPITYRKAWWSYYVHVMKTGQAHYVELDGNEP
jgi:hypothetical protein